MHTRVVSAIVLLAAACRAAPSGVHLRPPAISCARSLCSTSPSSPAPRFCYAHPNSVVDRDVTVCLMPRNQSCWEPPAPTEPLCARLWGVKTCWGLDDGMPRNQELVVEMLSSLCARAGKGCRALPAIDDVRVQCGVTVVEQRVGLYVWALLGWFGAAAVVILCTGPKR